MISKKFFKITGIDASGCYKYEKWPLDPMHSKNLQKTRKEGKVESQGTPPSL